MMSSPPLSSSPSSSAPPLPGVYEATLTEADLDQVLRERVRAQMAELDLGIELLPSSPTG
jgi:hypothetical protein